MNKVVVDTDVVSFAFRADTRYSLYERHLEGNLNVISFMTYAELIRGALNRNWGEKRRAELAAFVKATYTLVYPNQEICAMWAFLTDQSTKGGRKLQTADGWIAATAATLELPLVTHNARDFSYLPRLNVITET